MEVKKTILLRER